MKQAEQIFVYDSTNKQFRKETFNPAKHRPQIQKSKNIVIKAGSKVLTREDNGLDNKVIAELSRQMSELHYQGINITYVTSGSITTGMGIAGMKEKPTETGTLQVLSSIGQAELMHVYKRYFTDTYGITIGQILLEDYDIKPQQKAFFENTRQLRIIPICNANDPTYTGEVGKDNDGLAGKIAKLTEADLLILLTEREGLYKENPRANNAQLIGFVNGVDTELIELKKDQRSATGIGKGGINSKLTIPQQSNYTGNWIIANGKRPNILLDILKGNNVGTYIVNRQKV